MGNPQLTRRAVERVLDDRTDLWTPLNSFLYELCRRYPDHTRNSEISAKVLLIGRSYAAAVERGVRNEPGTIRDTTVFYRKRIATPIRRAGLDAHLNKLRGLETITPGNAATVLAAHARLTDVLAQSIGQRKRSFSSKYLHFHAPNVVPVFDSLAAKAVKGYVRTRAGIPEQWESYDREYARFVWRYLKLREWISDTYGFVLDPRQMDRLLWKVAL